MRHGKSSWSDHSISDKERPLKKRGFLEATLVGKRLMEIAGKPDLLISSPALRALTTARIVAEQIEYPEKDILIQSDLYGAGLNDIFGMLTTLKDDSNSIMLFGHNPTFTQAVNHFQTSFLQNLPTSGCIGFDLNIDDWTNVENASVIKSIQIIPSQLK